MLPKELPKELIKAMKENNLVLFVGAGLSYKFVNKDEQPLGDWQNMVRQILESVEDLDYLKPLVDRYDPIIVLDLIEKAKVKEPVINFVKQFFSLPTDKNDYSLHKKLCRLSNKIITTNYDNAFERADDDFETKTAVFGRDYELSSLHNPSDKTLFKLHGSISDGGSMVLFPSNYDNLYNRQKEDAERIIFHLRNLITNKTILFLGCGMGDFQINNIFLDIHRILGKYNKRMHYIIAKETKLDSQLNDFLELIPITDYPEIETRIDELLSIKELEDKNNDHSKQLEELKEKLKHTTNKNNTFSINYAIEGYKLAKKKEYEKSFREYKVATEFNAEDSNIWNLWGIALADFAIIKQDENLFKQSFEKYEKATNINPQNDSAFYNWGTALSDLAKIKQDENLFKQSFEKYEKAYNMNPERSYNYACGYALLGQKEKALCHLEESLKNKRIDANWVLKDTDWSNYWEAADFIDLINRYK